jgi:hypothetical protein
MPVINPRVKPASKIYKYVQIHITNLQQVSIILVTINEVYLWQEHNLCTKAYKKNNVTLNFYSKFHGYKTL